MNSSLSHGRRAVARAALTSDYVVLAITFICFFLMSGLYFIVTFIAEVIAMIEEAEAANQLAPGGGEIMAMFIFSLVGMIGAFVFLLLIGMFIVRMQRQAMLGNSLQVEYSDYAWLRDWANTVAYDLDMPRVEIFVTQNPVINAYAFGFIRPYCIVLNSGSIRYLSREELKAIVVHEMAHIKYGHTTASVYLQPFLVFPVIGVITSYLAGFWQRRAELTADRLALMYIGDAELVKRALISVYVGPDVADAMNQTARDWLRYNAERPMNRLAQTFSSHPFLVRRLTHVDYWKHVAEQPAVHPHSG